MQTALSICEFIFFDDNHYGMNLRFPAVCYVRTNILSLVRHGGWKRKELVCEYLGNLYKARSLKRAVTILSNLTRFSRLFGPTQFIFTVIIFKQNPIFWVTCNQFLIIWRIGTVIIYRSVSTLKQVSVEIRLYVKPKTRQGINIYIIDTIKSSKIIKYFRYSVKNRHEGSVV